MLTMFLVQLRLDSTLSLLHMYKYKVAKCSFVSLWAWNSLFITKNKRNTQTGGMGIGSVMQNSWFPQISNEWCLVRGNHVSTGRTTAKQGTEFHASSVHWSARAWNIWGSVNCYGQGLDLPHRRRRKWTWIDSALQHRYLRCEQMDPESEKEEITDTYEQHVMFPTQTIVCKSGHINWDIIGTYKSLYKCCDSCPATVMRKNKFTPLLRTWIMCFNPLRGGGEGKMWQMMIYYPSCSENKVWQKKIRGMKMMKVMRDNCRDGVEMWGEGRYLLLCPLASHCPDRQSTQWL